MQIGNATILHIDCMEYMKTLPDNAFDLAIVDPPYFDGPQKPGYYGGTKQLCDVGQYKDISNSWAIPGQDYFDELKRVSVNQIIWGANHFSGLFKFYLTRLFSGMKRLKPLHLTEFIYSG